MITLLLHYYYIIITIKYIIHATFCFWFYIFPCLHSLIPGERLLCGHAHLRGLSLRKAAMGGGLAAKRRALWAGAVV